MTPVVGDGNDGGVLLYQQLGHLIPQQPAQSSRRLREVGQVAQGDRIPGQEVRDQGVEGGCVGKGRVTIPEVAIEAGDLAQPLSVPVDREAVAIAVQKVRQYLQLPPLPLVMAGVAADVDALARCLGLDVAHQNFLVVGRPVRLGPQFGLAGFGIQVELDPADSGGDRAQQGLKRPAEVRLGFTVACQLDLRIFDELADDLADVWHAWFLGRVGATITHGRDIARQRGTWFRSPRVYDV